MLDLESLQRLATETRPEALFEELVHLIWTETSKAGYLMLIVIARAEGRGPWAGLVGDGCEGAGDSNMRGEDTTNTTRQTSTCEHKVGKIQSATSMRRLGAQPKKRRAKSAAKRGVRMPVHRVQKPHTGTPKSTIRTLESNTEDLERKFACLSVDD